MSEKDVKNDDEIIESPNQDDANHDNPKLDGGESVANDKLESSGVESKEVKKPKFNFSKLLDSIKAGIARLMSSFKKSEKTKGGTVNNESAKSKNSKLAQVVHGVKVGVVQAASVTGVKSKQFCSGCHKYLKEKSVIDKIKENKAMSFTIGCGVLILFLALIIFIFAHVSSSSHRPNAYNNLLRINTVQSELNKLQTQLTTTSQLDNKQKMLIESKLQDINGKLNEVSKGSGSSQKKQIQELRATIQSTNVGLYQKVNALNKEVAALKQKVAPAPTLSQKVLPFTVQDIDTWNGKAYAQIAQKSDSTMVGYVGLYQRTGLWKVIEINAPEQTVTFINRKGQVVHVQVKQF